MTRPARTLVLILASSLGLGVAAVPPASSSVPRFQGKAVGNSADGGRVAKKSFPVGAGYGLYLRDNRRSRTAYKLCAVFNGNKQRCVSGRTGRRGVDSIKSSPVIFNPQSTGRLDWDWYVGGARVARWTVTITAGD